MNNYVLQWVWLSLCDGVTPRIMLELYAKYQSIEAIYSETNYHNVHLMTTRASEALSNKSLDEAERIVNATTDIGGYVVPYDSADYPELLREINDPPTVLYVRGSLCLDGANLAIAIVGSRKCDRYGIDVCEYFAKQLALQGVATVSGLAQGIDTIVAKNTLDANGYTVAVLGCGLDTCYPKENKELMEEIATHGAVVSEFPIGTPPHKANFPRRNRIIAGIARGTLVAQAPLRSGSLITGNLALQYSRDVFAVPGEIFSVKAKGTNQLIAAGATLTQDVGDILDRYEVFEPIYKDAKRTILPTKTRQETIISNVDAPAPTTLTGLSEEESKIVSILLKGDMLIDDLVNELNLPIQDVKTTLLMMELNGIVEQKSGDVYGIIH